MKELSKEEIFEGEKIIAKFMGYVLPNIEFQMKWVGAKSPKAVLKIDSRLVPFLVNPDNENDVLYIETMPYFNSFNALISVVEKIEKIQLKLPSLTPVQVEIKGNSCRIFKGTWNEDKEGFISFVSYGSNSVQYTKKEATFLAVVEFIKWYNENVK